MAKVYDLVVYGGSIAGCVAAAAAAKTGKNVVLIERKSFLGGDVTSGLMTGCDEENNAVIKAKLFTALKNHNVDVLFMSDLTAVAVFENNVTGAVISNRFGQQIIYSKAIIDASGFPRLTEIADNTDMWKYRGRCGFCLKYSGENIPQDGVYKVSQNLGICKNEVYLRKSFDGELFVKFYFEVSSKNGRYRDLADWNSKATLLAGELAKELTILKDLRIIQASYEVELADSKKFVAESKLHSNIISVSYPLDIYGGFGTEEIEACVSYVENALDKLCFFEHDGKIAEIKSRNIKIPADKLTIKKFDDFKMKTQLFSLEFDYEKFLPVADKASVLVCGGGTGGFASALAAATETDGVVVVDENTGFGGTQTYGSVCRYYHGYVKGEALRQEELIEKSSPVYKRISYHKQLTEKNVKQYTGIIVCATLNTDKEINGVAIANSDFWGLIKADITVDGTGNADLLRFCGLKTQTGADRDGNLQDFSQSVIERCGLDLDVINHSKYSEILRGIELGTMQYNLGDFSTQITPRATSCFDGDYKITIKDILSGYKYDDCIAYAYTDSDAHGALSAIVHYMGFVPYHDKIFKMEIPYRAFMPKNFGRLLVAGKALSATPDAVGFFRMTADILNRGYAIGIAAAMASKTGDVRNINCDVLKEKLIGLEIIEKDNKDGETVINPLLEWICSDKNEVEGSIKKEFDKSKSLESAVALAWHGYDDGVDVLKNQLKLLLEKEKTEVYSDDHPNKPGNNKGGIIGETETYWKINQIITVLALLKETKCSDLITKAVNEFEAGGLSVRDNNEYVYGRIDLQRMPHFDRLRVLCFYIEKCPDANYCEALENLLERCGLTGLVCTDNIIGRNYQSAYTALTVIRALARCGSPKGVQMLVEYLDDIHYILAENAHFELTDIYGIDLGYDVKKWTEYAEANICGITPYKHDDSRF